MKRLLISMYTDLWQISIHQQFRINGTAYSTIFNLPIQVTNSIPQLTQLATIGTRPLCSLRQNPLQNQTAQMASVYNPAFQPYLGGQSVLVVAVRVVHRRQAHRQLRIRGHHPRT